MNRRSSPATHAGAASRRLPLGRTLAQARAALVIATLTLCALLGVAPRALAHQASDAYLRASTDADGRIAMQVDVALRDLDVVLELDADADGQLSWGEVRRREREIADHVAAHLQFDGGRCALKAEPGLALDRKADGVYAVLRYRSDCAAAPSPALAYRLFGAVDPTHRGLLVMLDTQGRPGSAVQSLVPGGAPVNLSRADAGTAQRGDRSATNASAVTTGTEGTANAPGVGFFADGLHHILIGADHVLFIVCLLLPLVLGSAALPGGWRARAWPLVGLVTAFTVGHSITLGLASLRVMSVPPSVIEPLIALTIALTALDNIRPFLGPRRVLAAFVFGLIHGFGFAGPLIELDLPPLAMAWALLQFNLGVEAGQLIVVALACAVLWPVRSGARARWWLRSGSAAAGLVALVWLAERLMSFKLLPV